MIRKYKTEGQMKQDLKRIIKRRYDMEKFYKVVDLLCEGKPLDPKYRNHPLKGDKSGKYDLHIESDWVLVYYLTDEYVYLSRTGTHSDLDMD
jgi:mRNA interferase YafQ